MRRSLSSSVAGVETIVLEYSGKSQYYSIGKYVFGSVACVYNRGVSTTEGSGLERFPSVPVCPDLSHIVLSAVSFIVLPVHTHTNTCTKHDTGKGSSDTWQCTTPRVSRG